MWAAQNRKLTPNRKHAIDHLWFHLFSLFAYSLVWPEHQFFLTDLINGETCMKAIRSDETGRTYSNQNGNSWRWVNFDCRTGCCGDKGNQQCCPEEWVISLLYFLFFSFFFFFFRVSFILSSFSFFVHTAFLPPYLFSSLAAPPPPYFLSFPPFHLPSLYIFLICAIIRLSVFFCIGFV